MIKKSTKLLLLLCLCFAIPGIVSAQNGNVQQVKGKRASGQVIEDLDQEELSRKAKAAKYPTMQDMVKGMQRGKKYNIKKVIKANGGSELFTGKYDNPALRVAYDQLRLQDPATGLIPENIREQELEYVQSGRSGMQSNPLNFRTGISSANASATQTSPWVNRGPFNVGGRTRALALDINDENRILAGGVSGGLWESTDQGANWRRVTPPLEHPSITGIIQDPRPGFQNTWYYSTGERLGNSASARNGSGFYQGNGVYKSVDNGQTWAVLPSTINTTPGTFSQAEPFDLTFGIDIDPTNGNVYVATFVGIYRSTDGGATFENVIPADFDNFTAIHITDGGILYATLDSGAGAAGTSSGVFRSTDGALGTWVNITDPSFPGSFGRTEIATAPSNPNILYVISNGTLSAPVGHDFWQYTYISGDGTGAGGTWENRSANLPDFGGSVGDFNSQGGYDLYVRVHPTNPDLVLIGGTNIYRSTDGFASSANTDWVAGYSPLNNVSLYTNQHPDQHNLVFLPSDPNTVISAHDGGLSMAVDITEDSPGIEPVTWTSLNNGYLTTQVYALSIGPGDQIMSGFQDNSTWFTNSTNSQATWTDLFSGDGSYNAFNDDGTLRYMSSQNGNVFRVTYPDANSTTPLAFQSIRPAGSSGFLFVNPFELDPNDDEIMYFAAGNTLWRNDDLPNANNSTGWTPLTNALSALGTISTIGISSRPANVVYYGTRSGAVYRIDGANTGNPTAVDLFTGSILPTNSNVTSIAVDPSNADRVYVAFSNYSIPSIFFSEDGGNSWTDVSGNLEVNPDGSGAGPSVRWINIVGNNDLLLVGTSTGLYSTDAVSGASTTWSQVDPNGIGNVVVEQVRSREDGLVVAGTHGNGLYSASFAVTQPQVVVANKISDLVVPSNSPDTQIDVSGTFSSNASPALAITVSVESISDTSLVTGSVSGDILTLSYMPNVFGTAVIAVRGEDINGDFATTNFSVEILPPPVSSFPYIEDFEGGQLPNGWETSGTMPWVLNVGGTPSADTGPLGDNTTGSGVYIYSEATGFNPGDQAVFDTRPLDLGSLTSPILEFQYHMFGLGIGSLEVEVIDIVNGTVTSVFSIAGPQQSVQTDPYASSGGIDLSAYSGSEIQLRFTATRGISFQSDIAVDDIRVFEKPANDVGVTEIRVTGAPIYSNSETVQIVVSNFGTNDQSNFPVSFSVDGGTAVTEVFAGTVLAGDTASFTFTATADLSTPGIREITAFTGLATDQDDINDSFTAEFNRISVVSTFPYLEDLEGLGGNLPAGWETAGIMPWLLDNGGTPSPTTGPLVDHTLGDATGTYLHTEASGLADGDMALLSIGAFDLSALDKPALLEFWYHMFGDGIGALEVEITDFATGVTTTALTLSGEQQSNQADDYLQAAVDLTDYAGSVITVRFKGIRGNRFTSDITIDDITVSEIDEVLDMELTPICTDNPEATRAWSVNNPNPFVREAFWFIVGTNQADSITLVPGENTIFSATAPTVPNTLRLRWLDADGVQQEASSDSEAQPCRVRGLILNSICSNDPDVFKAWEIVNRNPFTVSVEWNLVGTDVVGVLNCAPGTSSFFTEAIDGDNFVKIIWIDEEDGPRRQQKLSDAGMCASEETSDKDTALARVGNEVDALVRTYPNPFTDRVSVTLKVDAAEDREFTILVYDLFGGLVYEGVANSSLGQLTTDINTENFAVGTYILRLSSNDMPIDGSQLLIKR